MNDWETVRGSTADPHRLIVRSDGRRYRPRQAGGYDRGVPDRHRPDRQRPAPDPDDDRTPHPPELRPAQVNAKALFLVGTGAWLAGLIAFGVAVLAGRSPDPLLAWICLAGILFGVAGYWWAHVVHLVDDEGMSK